MTLAAPELADDQLVDLDGLADAAGLAPPTSSAYLSPGEADVPLPQAGVNGRRMSARPVAQE